MRMNCIYIQEGQNLNIDKLMNMPESKQVWLRGLYYELGTLSQGFESNNITGTNTIWFIKKIYNFLRAIY